MSETDSMIIPGDKGAIQTTHSGFRNGYGSGCLNGSVGLNFAEVSAFASKELLTHEAITRNSVLSKDTQIEVLKQASELRFELATHLHANAAAMATGFAALAKEVAASARETQDLIRSIDTKNSAIALQDAKDEIMALKTKLGVTP